MFIETLSIIFEAYLASYLHDHFSDLVARIDPVAPNPAECQSRWNQFKITFLAFKHRNKNRELALSRIRVDRYVCTFECMYICNLNASRLGIFGIFALHTYVCIYVYNLNASLWGIFGIRALHMYVRMYATRTRLFWHFVILAYHMNACMQPVRVSFYLEHFCRYVKMSMAKLPTVRY
jgi:hypothetical protein